MIFLIKELCKQNANVNHSYWNKLNLENILYSFNYINSLITYRKKKYE